MNNEYDIDKAFQRIEEKLIKSMKYNLTRHLKEEKLEGMNWSMWQTEQLKTLEQFKKENKNLFKNDFLNINTEIEEMIKKNFENGELTQENKILNAILKKNFRDYSKTSNASFFKINERKLNALIKETKGNFNKAEKAILRYTNDQYRQIIYDAQVYANTGAGTVEQAVDMATQDFLSKGINCIQYANGAMVNIASYARMAIRTANKRAYLEGEGQKRAEWGVHTVLVPNRGGGCPYCIKYQGKVFIDDVWSGGTAKESTETGYPLLSTAVKGGLFHPNCKDTAVTYFPGINSEVTPPTKQELEEKEKNYRIEQRQRYNERQIRKYKRLEMGSIDEGNIQKYHQKRVEWQKYNKEYCEKYNLKRRYDREKVYNNETALKSVTNTKKDDTISESIQTIKNLNSSNIEYIPVQKLDKKLTSNEIIDKISGGDETNGSCSSMALAYIGNKNGLNILDYRGGESQSFFSTPQNIFKMCDDLKINYEVEINYNDILGATNLLNKVEEGKEYYFSTGEHTAIVRRTSGRLQYLELQSNIDNGFKQFTSKTLKERFGCKQTHSVQGYKLKAKSLLVNIDEFTNKDEFEEILGYINTSANKQLKGGKRKCKVIFMNFIKKSQLIKYGKCHIID